MAALGPGLAKDRKTLLSKAMAITSDGKTLYAGYFDGSVRIWDLRTKKLRGTLPGTGGAGMHSLALCARMRNSAVRRS